MERRWQHPQSKINGDEPIAEILRLAARTPDVFSHTAVSRPPINSQTPVSTVPTEITIVMGEMTKLTFDIIERSGLIVRMSSRCAIPSMLMSKQISDCSGVW